MEALADQKVNCRNGFGSAYPSKRPKFEPNHGFAWHEDVDRSQSYDVRVKGRNSGHIIELATNL